MIRFNEFRKRRLLESMPGVSVLDGIDNLFDILRLDMLEAARLPATITESYDGEIAEALNWMIDYDNHRHLAIIDEHVARWKAEFNARLVEEAQLDDILSHVPNDIEQMGDAGEKLKRKIGWTIDQIVNSFEKEFMASMVGAPNPSGGSSPTNSQTQPAPIGHTPQPTPVSGPMGSHVPPGGPIPPAPQPVPAPTASTPSAPVPGGPTPSTSSSSSPWWKSKSKNWGPFNGLVNMGKSAARGIGRWVKNAYQGNYLDHRVRQLTAIMESLYEEADLGAASQLEALKNTLKKYIIQYINDYLNTLGGAQPSSAAPTAPKSPSSPAAPAPASPPGGFPTTSRLNPDGSAKAVPPVNPAASNPAVPADKSVVPNSSQPTPTTPDSSPTNPAQSKPPEVQAAPPTPQPDPEAEAQKVANSPAAKQARAAGGGENAYQKVTREAIRNGEWVDAHALSILGMPPGSPPLAPGTKVSDLDRYNAWRAVDNLPKVASMPDANLTDDEIAEVQKRANDKAALTSWFGTQTKGNDISQGGKKLINKFASHVGIPYSKNKVQTIPQLVDALMKPGVVDNLRRKSKPAAVKPTDPATPASSTTPAATPPNAQAPTNSGTTPSNAQNPASPDASTPADKAPPPPQQPAGAPLSRRMNNQTPSEQPQANQTPEQPKPTGQVTPEAAQRGIDGLDNELIHNWIDAGVPKADQVKITPEEVMTMVQQKNIDPTHLVSAIGHFLWIPKYAQLMGVDNQTAMQQISDYIHDHNNQEDETNPEATPSSSSGDASNPSSAEVPRPETPGQKSVDEGQKDKIINNVLTRLTLDDKVPARYKENDDIEAKKAQLGKWWDNAIQHNPDRTPWKDEDAFYKWVRNLLIATAGHRNNMPAEVSNMLSDDELQGIMQEAERSGLDMNDTNQVINTVARAAVKKKYLIKY